MLRAAFVFLSPLVISRPIYAGAPRTAWRALASLAILGWLAGCAGVGERNKELRVQPTAFSALSGWMQDRQDEALSAFLLSCDKLEAGSSASVGKGALSRPRADWRFACQHARQIPAGDAARARGFFEAHFTPYLVTDGNGDASGLFTGYYEPMLRGSRKKHGPYTVPVYGMPRGAKRFSRAEIDAGALKGKAPVIAWVDDATELFFLHIQGSGRIALDNGEELRVGYAGENGHEYVAIGKVLIDRGEMVREEVSMQSIKAWLRANPQKARALKHENPSYIFLRVLEGPGPIGAQGVALTPERSLAIDDDYLSYGIPVYLETQLPVDAKQHWFEPHYQRLLIAQDTGGAIRGVVRGDVFFGHGERAETLAGYMKQPGRFTVLLPNRRP